MHRTLGTSALVLAFAFLLPQVSHAAVNRLDLRPVLSEPGPLVVSLTGKDSVSKVADFLIQDVCLSAKGKVLPLDPASPSCANRRNLKYGEKLPYHKHDQHGSDSNPAAASGYQRSDSFPVARDLSLVGHSFDFGVGGSTFGRKDSNDGFNLYETRGTYASAIATEDAVGGVQYFVAPACSSGNGNEDSWGLFPTSMQGTGSNLFSLQIAQTASACPTSFSQSLTAWEFPSAPLTYTNGAKLETALSYHYAGPTIAGSDHLEKFYFTREYGATRWERWERPNTPYHAQEKEHAASKAATGVCNGPSVTSDVGGSWYLVDCREWTKIMPDTRAASKWYNPLAWNIPSLRSTVPTKPIETPPALTTPILPPPAPVMPAPPSLPSDLTIANVKPVTATAGVPFTMAATVRNDGAGSTVGSFSNFWRVCDLGCATVNQYGSGSTPALAAGGSRSVSFTYTLANPGTYYYTMCTDLPAGVTESNEDNNCYVGVTITVQPAFVAPPQVIERPQRVEPVPFQSPTNVESASVLKGAESALKGLLKRVTGN